MAHLICSLFAVHHSSLSKNQKCESGKKKNECTLAYPTLPFARREKPVKHLHMNGTLVSFQNHTANASRPAVPKGNFDHQLY
jgi:hypothetical protein